MKSKTVFIDILSPAKRLQLDALIAAWVFADAIFWFWWLQPSHISQPFLFFLNSLFLSWTTVMPIYFFFFLRRMKKPNPALSIPREWRVAMVTTRAPSEPFEVLKKTLRAMLAQETPHDTWLADEDPSEEIVRWCEANDVFICSRRGAPQYHRNEWPRRKKCKEGNLAWFYDNFGYKHYDFVSQLDGDHVPTSGYLEAMLRPFHDPTVGYVTAPSICSNNARNSWIARGRLYLEATLHGVIQAGCNDGYVSVCIGSHYAVRTKALQMSGGLGPELAEDNSTSLLLASHGWQGRHSIDAIAHGDGPNTFSDGIVQEFQWARSLVMILLLWTPKYLPRLPLRQKFQFLFGQCWYFGFSLTWLLAFTIAPLAILLKTPFANVNYLEFVLHASLPTLASLAIFYWIKAQRLLRPVDAKILNWEVAAFQLCRWPWVLCAVYDAVRVSIVRSTLEWKVTPKNVRARGVPFRLIAPYFLIIVLSFFVIVLEKTPATHAYLWLSFINGLTYIGLLVLIFQQETKNKQKEGY